MIDVAGNEIHEGAIIKVFHFIGKRKSKNYMYKQAGETVVLGGKLYRKIYHLPKLDDGYYVKPEVSVLEGGVVVQCICDFHIYNRLKRSKFYGP